MGDFGGMTHTHMGSYDNDPVQHPGPYTPAEMRFLSAQEAYGFLVRMRAYVTPEVPHMFVQVLGQAAAIVGVLMALAEDGRPATALGGERLGEDAEEG